MELYKIRIDDFIISPDHIIIKYREDKFMSKIEKGSIGFKIVNEDNREIPLSYINVGDKIKIYGNKIEKNNIIIKKIIIKNKYIFNSESSEDLDIYIN